MSDDTVGYSFEKINYLLRPCKQIERKIIIETLQNLKPAINIREYKYIGMGSIHYYDFILFHKFLNMTKFLSIDDKEAAKRFNFNKPYDFIEFRNTNSADFLNDFEWKEKVIIWLDYDVKLNMNVLGDIEIIVKNCNPGDILLFTVNAKCPKKEERKKFIRKFKMYISQEYQNNKSTTPKNFVKLIQNICLNFIKTKEQYQEKKFHKIFSFKYQDGAPMFTLGGIFHENGGIIEKIKDNEFVNIDDGINEINVPILTHCEKFHLDQNIIEYTNLVKKIKKDVQSHEPNKRRKEMRDKMNKRLPFELSTLSELENYIVYCRYFPQYYEGIL